MAKPASLAVQFQHRQGALLVNAEFHIEAPWSILFGPSGSGKSTMLQGVAGLLEPKLGEIVCRPGQGSDERVLLQTARKISVAPWLRPFRSAAQSPRLFPHMTVEGNVRYGAAASLGGAALDTLVHQVLQLLRLEPFALRRPDRLSGGEQQRVSVARAVLSAASLQEQGTVRLLLDEPFSGMGAALRERVPLELREWLMHRGIPVLSVSHDIGEAFLLEAEVLRVEEGRVVDQGPVKTVLAEERTRLLERLGGLH